MLDALSVKWSDAKPSGLRSSSHAYLIHTHTHTHTHTHIHTYIHREKMFLIFSKGLIGMADARYSFRTCRYILNELIDTEKEYVRDLGLVVNVCFVRLLFSPFPLLPSPLLFPLVTSLRDFAPQLRATDGQDARHTRQRQTTQSAARRRRD